MTEILACRIHLITVTEKLKYLLNNLSQHHFIHKSCMDWPRTASIITGQPINNLSYGMVKLDKTG
jgi:hypothetical protein